MKRLMLATTALFALSGVTVAAADISISGHVRFHYDAWSDDKKDTDSVAIKTTKNDAGDFVTAESVSLPASANNNNATSTELNIWVKGSMVTDGGLTIAPEARLESAANGGTRHYIKLMDDWGTIILGNHHTPAYTMSVGADWRGTVSGVAGTVAPKPANGNVMTGSVTKVTGHKDTKVIYVTPNFGGFKGGVSFADAGAESKANATEFVAEYGTSVLTDGNIRLSYVGAMQSAKDGEDKSTKQDNNEIGVEFTKGPFLVSVLQLSQKATPKKETETRKAKKQGGQEVEVAYDVSSNFKVNFVYFSAKVDEDSPGDASTKDDKYKATGIGAKYTIAPGLWASLGYNAFKYTDATKDKTKNTSNEGNSYRIRVHASF